MSNSLVLFYPHHFQSFWWSAPPYTLAGECHAKFGRAKIGPGGPLLTAKFGPTPDNFWLPKEVRVAKSGPGI